jgi:hypothetical protein
MGRLLLFAIGALAAIFIVLWVVHVVFFLFWIALFLAIVFVVGKLAFAGGRRSRR